ncbi:TraB/GumN family protein [Candidatus Woesearchaeota archaeon]|nr:TraB/GumN family protein [Candidatus Woesearchaeota archaeon]
MENLIIVGTSHIARQSIHEVTHAIDAAKPDIIAIELDRGRLAHLLHPQKSRTRLSDIRRVGVKGWLFGLFGAWAERALGKHVGVAPGQDMLTAVRLARERKLPLALVDQEIAITLKRFSQALTWREKGRFLVDVIKGVIFREKELGFDLRTVPSKQVIARLLDRVKRRYPNVYRVLVTERNHVMARNLAHLLRLHPDKKVVAIVGAGHEKELEALVRQRLASTKAI